MTADFLEAHGTAVTVGLAVVVGVVMAFLHRVIVPGKQTYGPASLISTGVVGSLAGTAVVAQQHGDAGPGFWTFGTQVAGALIAQAVVGAATDRGYWRRRRAKRGDVAGTSAPPRSP